MSGIVNSTGALGHIGRTVPGASMVYLAGTTFASAASQIIWDNVISSTYKTYYCVAQYQLDGSSPSLQMRFRTSGSADVSTGNYIYQNTAYTDSGGSDRGNSNTGGNDKLVWDNDSGNVTWNNMYFYLFLGRSGSSVQQCSWLGRSFMYRDSATRWWINDNGGCFSTTIDPRGMRFYLSNSDNISINSYFRLYGLTDS